MSIRFMTSTARLLLGRLLAVMVMVSLSAASFAAPMTWTLQNVMFNDGGTAMGSFVYDAATDTFSNISITTTPGSIRNGATYTTFLDILMAPPGELSLVTPPPPIQENITERLTIMLMEPLPAGGGTVDIAFVTELTCLPGLGCSFVTGEEPGLALRFDFPSEGFVSTLPISTIPEPGALTLLGLGLLIFAAWRRRKPRNKTRHPTH